MNGMACHICDTGGLKASSIELSLCLARCLFAAMLADTILVGTLSKDQTVNVTIFNRGKNDILFKD